MTVQYPAAHSPLRTPATLVVAGLWTMSVLSVARVLLAWQTGPLVTLFSGVLTLGWLYTATTFMVWLYQARQALDRRGETGMRWATGWTIGGWFIPLANLVIPARVVAEVYARSAPGAVRGWQTPRLVVAWWFVFLLSVVHVTYQSIDTEARVIVVHGVVFWNVVNGIAGCVAAVLAVRLVRRVTDWQADWVAPVAA